MAAPVGMATPAAPPAATPPGAAGALTDAEWQALTQGMAAAMPTFAVVGAAVALVTADGIARSQTFGVRNLANGAPVTADTHFLVASTAKSMTALWLATRVDDGALAWDQPVREVWTDFRAPTDELTKILRVRDLLGMASGIGEPPPVALHEGDPTAAELLQSLATLPVIAPPQTKYFYNNTVYGGGGYLAPLLQGASGGDLTATYAQLLAERVYRPCGMTTARIADDPRPFVTDYATGYAPDFVLGTAPEPYAPVGSYAPVGGTLASLTDMATYVTLQLRQGAAASGTRVVSAANLAECWQPHISIPLPPTAARIDPDLRSAGYGRGWASQTYKDGRRLVSHNGGVDGFTTFIGFFPDDNLGVVVLTNVDPSLRGLYFIPYVLDLLLSSHFGLNRGAGDAITAQYRQTTAHLHQLATQARPVDPTAIAPYLGHYEKGWALAFDPDGTLRLRQSSHALRLLAMPDGSYVMAGGVLPRPACARSSRSNRPWPAQAPSAAAPLTFHPTGRCSIGARRRRSRAVVAANTERKTHDRGGVPAAHQTANRRLQRRLRDLQPGHRDGRPPGGGGRARIAHPRHAPGARGPTGRGSGRPLHSGGGGGGPRPGSPPRRVRPPHGDEARGVLRQPRPHRSDHPRGVGPAAVAHHGGQSTRRDGRERRTPRPAVLARGGDF